MRDLFKEIWSTLSNNKLRTALTGFAVSWGIFLLICLLGAGNGLMNSFMGNSEDFVKNSMQVWGGRTSKAYAGYNAGRRIRLDEKDVEITAGKEFKDHIDIVSPVSESQSARTVFGTNSISATLSGVMPDYQEINKIIIKEGRFINPLDIKDLRKTAVIGSNLANTLVEGTHLREKDLIGKTVKAGEGAFTVAGIYQADESQMGNEIFIPFTTMKAIYSPGQDIGTLAFTFHGLESIEENEAFEKEYGGRIKSHHDADPTDESAIWIWNRYSQNLQMNKGQAILQTFLWILGLLTLVSGIVGVSNIMLISVKERTHEFGIRKAIGAAPKDILKLIIAESVTITAFFGYIGMLLGMTACEIMDKTIGQRAVDVGFTRIHILENPTVGLDVALEATLLLIIAGTLAGLAPARKASKVRPIEALRAE